MPQKKKRGRGKQPVDTEQQRVKFLAQHPSNALIAQQCMRMPTLRLFCVVFSQLAVCKEWVKKDVPPLGMHVAGYLSVFRWLCRAVYHGGDVNNYSGRVTAWQPSEFHNTFRRTWHRMMEENVPRSVAQTELLWAQIREMGEMHVSARVIHASIALGMGLDRRLGAESPFARLDTDLVRMIALMLRPDGMVLWVDALFET